MLSYPNAKINIGLDIVEKRPDGYHNIETVFYPIGLCDVLNIEPSETCSDYSFSSSGIMVDSEPEDNLIVKAYRKLQSYYALAPIDISFQKNIPFGAGLGGGSADAAFTLKMLNELFKLNISNNELEKIASELGADCAFFINNEPVFASGIGNEFEKIDLSLDGYFLVLVKPDIHIPTPLAYSKVVPTKPALSLAESIKNPISEWKNCIKNDFEMSVFAEFPEIEQIKNQLYDASALYASMSGSGSSVYAIFDKMPELPESFEKYFVSGGIIKSEK